jgi:hypothetical protein
MILLKSFASTDRPASKQQQQQEASQNEVIVKAN